MQDLATGGQPVARVDDDGAVTGRRLRVRRSALVTAAALAVLVTVGGAVVVLDDPLDVAPAVGATDVALRDDAFGPAVIEIEPGTEVTWTFDDGEEEHNIVGQGWGDDSPRASGTYQRTFDKPGGYAYRCTLHFRMSGRVDVVAPPSS
ncbi:hypothetical protein BH23ACT10_BH23ACT10_29690 [soil metagenome]